MWPFRETDRHLLNSHQRIFSWNINKLQHICMGIWKPSERFNSFGGSNIYGVDSTSRGKLTSYMFGSEHELRKLEWRDGNSVVLTTHCASSRLSASRTVVHWVFCCFWKRLQNVNNWTKKLRINLNPNQYIQIYIKKRQLIP